MSWKLQLLYKLHVPLTWRINIKIHGYAVCVHLTLWHELTWWLTTPKIQGGKLGCWGWWNCAEQDLLFPQKWWVWFGSGDLTWKSRRLLSFNPSSVEICWVELDSASGSAVSWRTDLEAPGPSPPGLAFSPRSSSSSLSPESLSPGGSGQHGQAAVLSLRGPCAHLCKRWLRWMALMTALLLVHWGLRVS